MNASTITGSTFTLVPQGGSAVAATVSYNASGNVATLTPTAPLANGTIYTATITTGVMSSGGSALASSYSWTFTTVALPAPTVTSVTPVNADQRSCDHLDCDGNIQRGHESRYNYRLDVSR